MAINRNNYEEYFLLYIDRELGRDEQLMVEDYVRLHPDLEKEFDLLKQTIALPPVMIFEGKEKLFKEEKKRRILPVFWMRIAATLIILLAGGWFLLVITGKTKKHAETTTTASNQMVIHQDGNKKKVPEPSAMPANPAVVTNSAGGTNPPNEHYITRHPASNPEKESPEANEAFIPSTRLRSASAGEAVKRQPSTEFINHQPSMKAEIADIAQNNKLPEINAPNPSTIHHPPSTVPPSTRLRFASAGEAPNRQPSTIPPSTVNRQPSTDSADAPENSQSILVFDNNNKTVTGFFKKLLAKSGDEQVTADNRKRKIKISVFQFNVSK